MDFQVAPPPPLQAMPLMPILADEIGAPSPLGPPNPHFSQYTSTTSLRFAALRLYHII